MIKISNKNLDYNIEGEVGRGVKRHKSPLGDLGVYYGIFILVLIVFTSCEEVIQIDLNTADPAFVAEAIIYRDSVCTVNLTQTSSYFSQENPVYIEDASISLSDGSESEILQYMGKGLYRGSTITGTEGKTYSLEIEQQEKVYVSTSTMPEETEINSTRFVKDNTQSILNPTGETVFTISVNFTDNPDTENYYMVTFVDTSTKQMIEKRYFMLTETSNNGGSLDIYDDTIFNFGESIFYEGGIVEVGLHSIDEDIYNYFMQLDDVLFWKRRVMPPVPYNAKSNISNGALGYFSAMGYDYEILTLE